MAGYKSSQFSNVHTYLVDVDVLKNEASTAVSHMEQDKEGIRIDINTPVLEVVNLQTFLDLNLVVNNTEIPPPGMLRTRSDMWYTTNQDHYYRTPGNTSQEGDHSNLLNEEQLQRLCGHMFDFAKQVGYGLRTYNREVDSSASSDSGMINIHQLAMMMKRMPESMDHPLGFALNSLQAFAICLHVIHRYTSWREYMRLRDRIIDGPRTLSPAPTSIPSVTWSTIRMQFASCILKMDFSFRPPSSSMHGIKWVLSLDTLPTASVNVMHCNAGNMSSP